MPDILVTGCNGTVGSFLRDILQERGHDVFGIDVDHAPGEVGWEHQMSETEFTYSRCDISSYRQLERVFDEAGPFDYVYHTAAEFGRWNGEDFYEQVWETNAIGTKHIIRLQEERDFRLIHFSSSEVYGDYEDVMSEEVMEEVPIKQMNDYAISKWANELQIRNSRIHRDTETVIVRLFNTYGPGEAYHPYRSVVAKFCYKALKNDPITVYQGHTRTSTYLKDSCEALCNIVDNFKPGEVYNIGGVTEHDIETLAEIIWDEADADPDLITYEDSEVLTTSHKKVDVSKAKEDLDMKESVTLREGIRRTLDWMKEHHDIV